MILVRRLTLISLLVALLLTTTDVGSWLTAGASPPGVGTASGDAGAIVDETLVWNQVMLDAIVASTLGNPQTMRMAATLNTAMFDAQTGVSQAYTPIFVTQTAPPGNHRRAAVVQAAYITLKAFYPEQLARFDRQRALSLAEFNRDDSAAVQRGIDWGDNVAKQVLAWRATDGFSNPVPPFNGAGATVGQWESATSASMSPGNISFTAPFALTSNTQFQWAFRRPWAPLDSAAYATSFNEMTTMGAKTGSGRTLEQTHIAFFFNGYATNDYVEAAIQIARARQTSRGQNSRILALLTIAMHDTSVTVFRAKRDFGMKPADVTWRPILAIPKADLDGNPNTAPIADWVPLITTPNHPEYPGSHPGSHGAGPRVLQHFFGDVNTFELHPAFNTVFPGPPEGGVRPRRYTRISDMAQEGIAARTYGGMHFRGASHTTAEVGARIADYILANAARPVAGKDDSDSDEAQ
jgi:hypothetical protein